jgi:hypothetical protein
MLTVNGADRRRDPHAINTPEVWFLGLFSIGSDACPYLTELFSVELRTARLAIGQGGSPTMDSY